MLGTELMLELVRLAEEVTAGTVVDEVLAELADLGARAAGTDGADVLIAQPEGLRAVGRDDAGPPGRALTELRDRGPVARCALERTPVEAHDLTDESVWRGLSGPARAAGCRAVLALPVVCDGQCWGVLELRSPGVRSWTAEDRASARLCAGLAATWLQMAAVRAALDEVPASTAHRSVSSLPARGLVASSLEHALAVARRQGSRAGLMLVRLDCWAGAERALGLPGARQVLVEARDRVRATMRDSDAVTALGDDLLAVVCEDLRDDHRRAEEQLEAIGRRFAGAVTVEPHGGVSWHQVATTVGAVTSAGGSPATAVLDAAAGALDVALGRGRGRFVTADLA